MFEIESGEVASGVIEAIERLIRRDPAQRGLIATEAKFGPLCPGHLVAAAQHLAKHATHVGLVTGFYVPHGKPPAAETDGPPGTLMLARALQAVGIKVTVLTDDLCMSTIHATAEATGFDPDALVCYPHDSPSWIREFYTTGRGNDLTHLVAIERPGPSHSVGSLVHQQRLSTPPIEEFSELVPIDSHNSCHNMRGVRIDHQTADTYRLFDALRDFHPAARTIGVGDGGNEIGMGTIPWEELHRRLEGEHAPRIPCRIATDWTIVAGVSNWGGYALAAAVLLLRDEVEFLADWDAEREQSIIRHIVQHGPAVDGITARAEATVDGLPFATYIQPWTGMRRFLGLE